MRKTPGEEVSHCGQVFLHMATGMEKERRENDAPGPALNQTDRLLLDRGRGALEESARHLQPTSG
jgi:hypothetical protein